jgi:hypothetical protein
VDRAILAALPISHADLLEPDGDRLAIRHRVHRDPMREKVNRVLVAAVACCIPLMTSLSLASATEHRSHVVTREFQREHPCPSTGEASGAYPGYRKDHIVPLSCGGPDTVQNLQWQTIADAKAKDRWERKSCARR